MGSKPGPKRHAPAEADIELGARIRLRRVEQHMSQSKLGEMLGVSFQQVQKYEKGINRVGASRLELIADVLQVPVTFFYNGNGGSKHRREVESLLFVDSAFTLRLLRAYSAIKDHGTRRQFVTLMEHVAGTNGGK